MHLFVYAWYMHVGRFGKSCFDLVLLVREINHGMITLVLDDLIYISTETRKVNFRWQWWREYVNSYYIMIIQLVENALSVVLYDAFAS